MTNPQKGIWSITMPDMINPQNEIYIMNNDSIINRILFAVTIFQHKKCLILRENQKMDDTISLITPTISHMFSYDYENIT